jgi:signal recognition particle subunit SRP19
MRVRVPGAPPPDLKKPYPVPAVPKGWKLSTILPYYSPAVTGGGVSDNFFKDMMAEMGGAGGAALPPGMAGLENMMGALTGGSEKEPNRKEKRKKVKG